MNPHLRRAILSILAALLLAGCAATAPTVAKVEVGTVAPAPRVEESQQQEKAPPSLFFPDRDLFDEGIAFLHGPDRIDPAKARTVFASLLQRYPQSRWRAAAETLIRFIDAGEVAHERDQKARLLTEQLLTDRARALQENEQLKKTIRDLTEKLQTETAMLNQENDKLKQDLQRLKALEIELEKRERMLR
jgi:Skp family chaperone for outer membrane proteins